MGVRSVSSLTFFFWPFNGFLTVSVLFLSEISDALNDNFVPVPASVKIEVPANENGELLGIRKCYAQFGVVGQ